MGGVTVGDHGGLDHRLAAYVCRSLGNDFNLRWWCFHRFIASTIPARVAGFASPSHIAGVTGDREPCRPDTPNFSRSSFPNHIRIVDSHSLSSADGVEKHYW